MTVRFPRPAADFTDSIPHRPPFVWIDEVRFVTPEGGTCAITLKSGAHYMGPEGLRVSSYFEFMAQGFAYVRACQVATNLLPPRPPPTKAFLVSIQDAIYSEDERIIRPVPGDLLKVEILGIREIGPITLFSASIRDHADVQLVHARLKVFSE